MLFPKATTNSISTIIYAAAYNIHGLGEAMFKKSSRFNTSLRQRGLSPQSASHAHVGVAKGRRKSRKVLDLEASAKGRTVREWFAYLTACKQQGSPAYGVPEEILDAWTVAQHFEA